MPPSRFKVVLRCLNCRKNTEMEFPYGTEIVRQSDGRTFADYPKPENAAAGGGYSRLYCPKCGSERIR